MAVELEELRLVWPAELFVTEARVMRARNYSRIDDLGALLDEAFADGLAYRMFQEADSPTERGRWLPPLRPSPSDDPWASDPLGEIDANWEGVFGPPASIQLFDHLVDTAGQIPAATRRAYYRERQLTSVEAVPRALARDEFGQLLAACLMELNEAGYFERTFGSTCADADSDPSRDGNIHLARAVYGPDHGSADLPRLWPPSPNSVAAWDHETTLSVIEALHDVVARPRTRFWHEYAGEWDYQDYARSAGQLVYHWRINALLDRTDWGLRLAADGADRGLLVRVQHDDRDELTTAVLDTTLAAPERDRVDHAIATYRRRDSATRTEKRAAILSLAQVLEGQKASLKRDLLSGDEDALFHIANKFDLRHHRADQYSDYGDEFLDWVYWWYLATVELAYRLKRR